MTNEEFDAIKVGDVLWVEWVGRLEPRKIVKRTAGTVSADRSEFPCKFRRSDLVDRQPPSAFLTRTALIDSEIEKRRSRLLGLRHSMEVTEQAIADLLKLRESANA